MVTQKSKQNIIPIDIQREYYTKLQELSKTKSLSLRKFTNQVIREYIEIDSIKLKYFPSFKKIGFDEGIMYIDDKTCNNIAKIKLHDQKLTCNLHEGSNVCDHILYAAMCSDLNKLVSPIL